MVEIIRPLAIVSVAVVTAILFSGCNQYEKKVTPPAEPINAFDAAVRTYDTTPTQSAYDSCIAALKTLLSAKDSVNLAATEILPAGEDAYVKTGEVLTMGDITARAIQFGTLEEDAGTYDTVLVQYIRSGEESPTVEQLYSTSASLPDITETIASVTAATVDTAIQVKIITSTCNIKTENTISKSYQFQFDGTSWIQVG